MKYYAVVVGLVAAVGLAGLALTKGKFQTQGQAASPEISSDVSAKIKQLSSADPNERASAACALGKTGAEAVPAIPNLIALLSDGATVAPEKVCYREYFSGKNDEPEFEGLKEPSPAEAAVQALIRLGEPSVEPLIAVVKDSQWRTRKNAVWALAQLRDQRALEPLLAAAKDSVWQVRAYASVALGEQKDRRVVEPLMAALKDENAAVRWFAAASLGQTSDLRAVEPLIAALKDAHPRTRAFAAGSLGQLRDSRTVLPLIESLHDTDTQVRMYAAASLGQQGDLRAREPLSAALEDKDAQVRMYAKASLDQLKN